MAFSDVRAQGGALLPVSGEPRRGEVDIGTTQPAYGVADRGTNVAAGEGYGSSIASLWTARQWIWRQAFEQVVSPRLRRYWHIWRNFDSGPSPGPGQEWRDRTVMPQAFKEIATRVPRLVMGLWGTPESYTVNGRGAKDETYEEQVRVLIDEELDAIGMGDPQGETFLKRIIDGTYYQQIMGHVWWKVFWRNETAWLKTKMPEFNDAGEIIRWKPVERIETLVDGIDVMWIPVSQLAIDVYGRRRWAIERIETSMESIVAENERHEEQFGQPLYPESAMKQLEMTQNLGTTTRESMDEPRDTEHWPLEGDHQLSHDPGEHPVELWLCWDNVRRTLTKIANRSLVLDHGLAPTPDGLDPYIGDPAVPIPGQPYGDSIFNWTSSLYTRQTRIVRGRMDEVLMGLFQQLAVREKALGSTTWFWRPGGLTTIKGDPAKPISNEFSLIPRRQIDPSAYQEEAHAQRQSEAVSAADSLTQGAEGTSKSRDVSAAEVNQRVLQGATRYQTEILYHEATFKRPLLQKIFGLLQQNMTKEKVIRVLDDQEGVPINLTQLQRPIDIQVGGSMLDSTQAEKLAELDKLTQLVKDQNFAAVAKHRELFTELLKSMRTLKRNSARFVKSEEDVDADRKQRAAAEAAAAGGAPAQAGAKTPPVPSGAEGPGLPGAAGLAGANGSNGDTAAPAAGGSFSEI